MPDTPEAKIMADVSKPLRCAWGCDLGKPHEHLDYYWDEWGEPYTCNYCRHHCEQEANDVAHQ